MPGAGLRPENTRLLLAQLPAIGEVHGSCSNRRPPTDPKPAQAAAIQQQQFCALLFGEPSAARTDADLVRAMKSVVVSVAREEGESVQ
jgi:copper homeostasis protein CutC